MFDRKKVRVSFVCTNSTFGCFEDLTSKGGRKHIAEKGFRHYIICRAPRIIFERFDKKLKKVTLLVQQDVTTFKQTSIEIETAINLSEVSTELESVEYTKYPEIKATLSNGIEVFFATAFEFLSTFAPHENSLLFLDTLYVGQTDPTEDYLRLVGHETFAKIADRLLKSEPQSALFIQLLKFADPVYEYADSEDDVDSSWSDGVVRAVGIFPPDHMTSLIEAALIWAIEPEYNTHYKDTFPSKTHTRYNFVFGGVIDQVEVIINQELRRYRLRFGAQVGNVVFIRTDLEKKA